MQKKAFAILAAEIVFVAAVVVGVILGAHTHNKRSMIVGILCVIFGSVMYASPLSVMVRDPSSSIQSLAPPFCCTCAVQWYV